MANEYELPHYFLNLPCTLIGSRDLVCVCVCVCVCVSNVSSVYQTEEKEQKLELVTFSRDRKLDGSTSSFVFNRCHIVVGHCSHLAVKINLLCIHWQEAIFMCREGPPWVTWFHWKLSDMEFSRGRILSHRCCYNCIVHLQNIAMPEEQIFCSFEKKEFDNILKQTDETQFDQATYITDNCFPFCRWLCFAVWCDL